MEKVVVLGAGSWGTALSMVLAQNGHQVILWEYQEELAKNYRGKEKIKIVAGSYFPENIEVVSESTDLLKDIKYVIFPFHLKPCVLSFRNFLLRFEEI